MRMVSIEDSSGFANACGEVWLTAGRADGYLGVEDVFAVRWLEKVYRRWWLEWDAPHCEEEMRVIYMEWE
jgi:hypothetical protein